LNPTPVTPLTPTSTLVINYATGARPNVRRGSWVLDTSYSTINVPTGDRTTPTVTAGTVNAFFYRVATVLETASNQLTLALGTDLDGNASFRSTDHGLHFFVKLRGNNRGDFFRAQVPPPQATQPSLLRLPFADSRFQESTDATLSSPCAEVALFLKDSGEVTV